MSKQSPEQTVQKVEDALRSLEAVSPEKAVTVEAISKAAELANVKPAIYALKNQGRAAKDKSRQDNGPAFWYLLVVSSENGTELHQDTAGTVPHQAPEIGQDGEAIDGRESINAPTEAPAANGDGDMVLRYADVLHPHGYVAKTKREFDKFWHDSSWPGHRIPAIERRLLLAMVEAHDWEMQCNLIPTPDRERRTESVKGLGPWAFALRDGATVFLACEAGSRTEQGVCIGVGGGYVERLQDLADCILEASGPERVGNRWITEVAERLGIPIAPNLPEHERGFLGMVSGGGGLPVRAMIFHVDALGAHVVRDNDLALEIAPGLITRRITLRNHVLGRDAHETGRNLRNFVRSLGGGVLLDTSVPMPEWERIDVEGDSDE